MTTPDDPSKLTKQQAAARAGVSTKTIEKWTKEGRLEQTRWRRPEGGPEIVVYLPEDVDRIAQERRPAPPAFILPPIPTTTGNGNGHGRPSAPGQALAVPPSTPAGYDAVRLFLEAMVAAVRVETSQNSEKSDPWMTPFAVAQAWAWPRRAVFALMNEGKLGEVFHIGTPAHPRAVVRRSAVEAFAAGRRDLEPL